MNAIPENWQNYRTTYALARVLENYSVIEDHNEGIPHYRGDGALPRVIDVLKSVREEGRDEVKWNMRMAYAYQYLFEQKEKAIPCAQRWAEPDLEDENAPVVIRDCQKEIAKRDEVEANGETGCTGVFTDFILLSRGEWDET